MPTGSLPAPLLAVSEASIRQAADIQRRGGLVIFPTDTVYGVGASLNCPEAVRALYVIKGREAKKPLQVLLPVASQLSQVARDLSPLAQRAAQAFFPGGVTLVVLKAPNIPPEVVANGPTIGVRVPDSTVCRALLEALGSPLVATSANRSGEPSPRTAQEALEQLGDEVDLVLDGGPCAVGQDSTVIDVTGDAPRILREGAVPRAEVERVLGRVLAS